MLFAAFSCLIAAQVQSPALVKVFSFGSGRTGIRKRVVIGTQQGGIYGLDPDTKRQTFNLSPLVNAPVTAIAEGYDGHYVWSVAGSSDIYDLHNGATESITTGLTTPVMRLDNWGDLLVVQGQNEVRFLDIRGNRNFSPNDIFARDRRPEFDIPTAISQGPCLFSWDRGLGTVISVARMGQLQTPGEPNGTQDLSYVRAWRVNARRQVQFLGGYFAPLVPFGDSNGFNEIKIGTRTYSGAVGLSRLNNFAITKEGVVVVTKSQIRALPFQKKNWDVDDPIQLPVAANYPSCVSGSGNAVWYADGKRIFQYSVDSGSLSVFIRKKPGDIRSVAGDETGVWIVTDTSVDRLSASDPDSVRDLGYLQLEVQGVGPVFGSDRRKLKKVLESPLPANTADPVWGAIKRSGIKPPANLQPASVGDLSYGDVVTQGTTKGFFVGNLQIRRWENGQWTNAPLDVTQPLQFVRVCREDPPVRRPNMWDSDYNDPVAPVPIGNNGIKWVPGSSFDQPYRPQHWVMKQTIESWLGTPYLWGGNSRDGIDCSGFVHLVFHVAGIEIPRQSQAIRWYRRGIYPNDQLKWGDVIAIDGHVLLYAGNGRTAESLGGGVGVTYGRVSNYRSGTVRRFIR